MQPWRARHDNLGVQLELLLGNNYGKNPHKLGYNLYNYGDIWTANQVLVWLCKACSVNGGTGLPVAIALGNWMSLITCLMSHGESLAKCEEFLTRHDTNIDTSAEGSRHALRTTHHNSQGLNLIYLGMQGQCFKSTSWRPKHEVQDASGLEQRHLFWIPPMPSHWFTLSLIDGLE